MVGLFGPGGCGKSTLLTAMTLINPPTSGRITIDGRPVMDGPRALVDARSFHRKNIGFIFQKPNLIPFLTALEINDTPSKEARERPLALLDYLGIRPRSGQRAQPHPRR